MPLNAETLGRLAALKLPARAYQELLFILADMQAAFDASIETILSKESDRKRRDRDRKIRGKSSENPPHSAGKSAENPGVVPPKPPSFLPSLLPLNNTSQVEVSKKDASNKEFDEFWLQYPNKVGKKDAMKAFARARKTVELSVLMRGLFGYSAKKDDRPWCNPATWLNQGRWDDRPAEGNGGNGQHRQSLSDLAFDLADEAREREASAGIYRPSGALRSD